MIKIKIFDGSQKCAADILSGYSLENEINQWLYDNSNIQIISANAVNDSKYYVLYYSWSNNE